METQRAGSASDGSPAQVSNVLALAAFDDIVDLDHPIGRARRELLAIVVQLNIVLHKGGASSSVSGGTKAQLSRACIAEGS